MGDACVMPGESCSSTSKLQLPQTQTPPMVQHLCSLLIICKHYHQMHCMCHHDNTHRVPQDEDLKRTHELFADVGKEKYPETDISAEQWLRNRGASSKVLAIADACYANDFGCSLHQLGLREMITENRKWDSGMGINLFASCNSNQFSHCIRETRCNSM